MVAKLLRERRVAPYSFIVQALPSRNLLCRTEEEKEMLKWGLQRQKFNKALTFINKFADLRKMILLDGLDFDFIFETLDSINQFWKDKTSALKSFKT